MRTIVLLAALCLVMACGDDDEASPTQSGGPPPGNEGITTKFKVLQNCGSSTVDCDETNANSLCAGYGYERATKWDCVQRWCSMGTTGSGWIYEVTCWKR